MVDKWNDYDLPQSVVINGNEYKFNSDYKSILEVMKPLNDNKMLDSEKIECACFSFYEDYEQIVFDDFKEAIEMMFLFIGGNKLDESPKKEKPIMDWEKDLSLIIAPINKMVGHDIRIDSFHWWTFLSYFSEIGESTFSTYVTIRNKKNKGKKLEKHEEEIFRNNKKAIELVRRYDCETQDILDEIKGLIGKR